MTSVPEKPEEPRAGATFVADPGSSLGQRLTRAASLELAMSTIALVGLVFVLIGAPRGVIGVTALVALLGPLTLDNHWRELVRGRGPTGDYQVSRTVLAVSMAALAVTVDVTGWISGGALALLVTFERSLTRIIRGAIPVAAHVPGLTVRNEAVFSIRRIFVVNTVAILLFGAVTLSALPSWTGIPIIVAAAVPSIVLAVDGILRIRARRVAEATLHERLEELAPRFLVHWDAPIGTEFQLRMWLPYLEAVGLPFLIVLRNPSTLPTVADATAAPVVVRRAARELDTVVTSTVRAAFYMNNASRNTHLVRFSGIRHIQLNHGDSDKPPSYSPVFRMFDKNFVAGQAAVDRFLDNDVPVRDGFFELVGRPQLEDVEPPRAGPVSTVLYAPTWGGHNADSDHSSLPIGAAIVQALLDRGLTVIYRPHPYTDRHRAHLAASDAIVEMLIRSRADGGGDHIVPPTATTGLTLIECFNASDAMISDVSAVTSDYLASGKPLAISTMYETPDEFAAAYPIGRAAYLIGRDGREIDDVVSTITGDDPLRDERRAVGRYVLGDTTRETVRARFVEAVRSVVG